MGRISLCMRLHTPQAQQKILRRARERNGAENRGLTYTLGHSQKRPSLSFPCISVCTFFLKKNDIYVDEK